MLPIRGSYFAFLSGSHLEAQNQQVAATVNGAITDPTGLALKDAKVTLTSAQNGISRHYVTQEDGLYSFTPALARHLYPGSRGLWLQGLQAAWPFA